MDIKKQAEDLFFWAKSQYVGDASKWEAHSINTARAAEWIAAYVQKKQLESGVEAAQTLDPAMAYACGYLHDIGRYKGPSAGLLHALIGRDVLTEHNLPVAAQVAMTHTYYGYNEIDRTEFWDEIGDEEAVKQIRDYMDKVELTDYDRLIQLVDNMAHHAGIMTINDRFCDIVVRHGVRDVQAHLKHLFGLKAYFDEKAGINLYELFKDDIIRTTMMDPNSGKMIHQVRKYHDQD